MKDLANKHHKLKQPQHVELNISQIDKLIDNLSTNKGIRNQHYSENTTQKTNTANNLLLSTFNEQQLGRTRNHHFDFTTQLNKTETIRTKKIDSNKAKRRDNIDTD